MFEVATPRTPLRAVAMSSAVGLGMAACGPSGRLTFLSTPLRELLGESFGSDEQAEPERWAALPAGRRHQAGARGASARSARQGEAVVDAVICHRSEAKAVPTYLRCNAAPVAAGSANGAVVFVEELTAGHEGEQIGRAASSWTTT